MRRATITMMIYVGVVLTIWVGINMFASTNSCLAGFCTGYPCVTTMECGSGCVCAKATYEVEGICATVD